MSSTTEIRKETTTEVTETPAQTKTTIETTKTVEEPKEPKKGKEITITTTETESD